MTVGEKQKIIDLYQTRVNGRSPSYTDIGREVGRSRASVRRVLERARLVTTPRARRLTVGETTRIIELYQTRKGRRWMSSIEVGKIVGRTPTTVLEVVARAGVARGRSEAATMLLSERQRQTIIRLSIEDGWPSTKIADALNLKAPMVWKVLNEAEADLTTIRAHEAALAVALYQQGRSAKDVADVTGRPLSRVATAVQQAGAMRPRKESARLAMRRIAASNKLAAMDLQPLAARWLDGAEVEELADEHELPADLLWDALADALSTMTPNAVICVRTCLFACTEVCAHTTAVGTSKARRRY